MKELNKSISLLSAVFVLVPFLSLSQDLDSTNHRVKKAAKAIMTSAETCALVTLDQEGRPRVRTMETLSPESDFTVWFGTNPKSRKVDQINKDPRVTLYYLESDASGYVMIHGVAQIVNDQKEKEKRWKVEWEAFYPNKTEDFVLLKVTPEWMEVISYTHDVIGDSITWEVPRVIFDAK